MLIADIAGRAVRLSEDHIPVYMLEKEGWRQLYLAKHCKDGEDNWARLQTLVFKGFLPQQIGGVIGPLATLLCWDEAADHSTKDLLLASLVGAEAGTRVGCALLLQDPCKRQRFMSMTSAIVALGKIKNLPADVLANALAIGLSTVPELSPRVMRQSFDSFLQVSMHQARLAIELARSGRKGDIGLFDASDGPFSDEWNLKGPWMWQNDYFLSDAMVLGNSPGPLCIHPILQSVEEILQRHLKAADKRLRWDQIEKIQISCPPLEPWIGQSNLFLEHGLWACSIPWRIAYYVLQHCWDAPNADWCVNMRDRLYHIVTKVEIVQHPLRRLEYLRNSFDTIGPVFASHQLSTVLSTVQGGFSRFGLAEKIRLHLQNSSSQGPRNDFHTDQFQFCYPTEVTIFTTRGGKWPERRVFPNGGPGSSKQKFNSHFGSSPNFSKRGREWVDEILQ